MGVFGARRVARAGRAPAITIEDLINALVSYLPSVADYRHATLRIDCDRFYRNTTIDLYGQFDPGLNRRVWVRVTIDDKAETSFCAELWAEPFVIRVDSKDLGLELALVIEPQPDRSIEIFRIIRWENGEPIFNRESHQIRCAIVQGRRAFDLPVFGELRYQRELEEIAGGRHGIHRLVAALLVPEPANAHDTNAVAVKIEKRTVGYLGSDLAPEFLKALAAGRYDCAAAGAAIVSRVRNNRVHLEVKLDVELPLALTNRMADGASR